MKVFYCCFSVVLVALVANCDVTDKKNEHKTDNRVANSIPAHVGQFPFMAAIYHRNIFNCSGVLISPSWVLTSASCIYEFQGEMPSQYSVSVGGLKHSGTEPGRERIAAFKVYPHHDFHGRGINNKNDSYEYLFYNNIGLIQLVKAAAINQNVQTIHLPEVEEDVPYLQHFLTGWGGQVSEEAVESLQYSTALHLMDLLDCTYQIPGAVVDEKHVCSSPYPDSTACNQDHGAPLFYHESGGIVGSMLTGIVNYAPCFDYKYPTVYARVSMHRGWINLISGV